MHGDVTLGVAMGAVISGKIVPYKQLDGDLRRTNKTNLFLVFTLYYDAGKR